MASGSPQATPPPQPSQDGPPVPNAQGSDTSDESTAQSLSKDTVTEPTPWDVDQGANGDMAGGDGGEKTQERVNGHQTSFQELKDRVIDLEQRLRQAGLLEKLEDPNESQPTPKEDMESNISKVKEEPELRNIDHIKDTDSPEESVQTLVDRIDSLEKRLDESGHLKDKPAADKPRLPAIPQLHYVEWSEFKNKLAEEEKIYAIEVLVGGAKYYHQRSEEERKNKQRLKDHSNDRDQPITDHKKSTSLPERIRINSKPVRLIMNQIDPMGRPEYHVVLLRPFKPLIYHEARIREIFQRLTEKWGGADTAPSTNQTVEPTDTGYTDNTTASKMSDEAIGSTSPGSGAQSKAEHTSDQISPPAFAIATNSSDPVSSESTEQKRRKETEEQSSEAVSKVEPKDTRSEETEDLTDSLEALRDLRCLIDFIDIELKPLANSYRDTIRQTVPFCDLWHLFKPGDLLHSPLGNKHASDYLYHGSKQSPQKPDDRYQEVWRIASTTGGRPHLEESAQNYSGTGHKSTMNAFLICAYWIDFGVTRFVSRTFVFYMIPFSGEQDITSLMCYPLRYAPKFNELKSKWKARGEAFREYTTFKHRYYTGKTLTCAPDGFHTAKDGYPKHAENIDSQVVVDFSEALDAHPGWRTTGSGLTLAPEDAPGELSEDYPTSYWKDSGRKVLDEEIDDEIYEDEHIDTKLSQEYIESDPLLRDHPQTSSASNGDLDENHLILLPNRVFAFVMKNRKWAMLTVDGLRPIKRYDGGFKDLQLPMGHKRTISSLVSHHFNNRSADLDDLEASYDADLVRGKGKGLIILLHGAPGVGKTSTAETIADAFGKILLPITCGDLGLMAADVESELSEKFHLAELWGCVLLLDEADVFLARRTNTDIKRNSLVSVFLRVLEYFTGVLFLTTNRVGAFDEAFKSRIHISLYYPPLDAEKTWSIWKMNLERLKQKKQRRNENMYFNENEIFAYAQNHFAKTFPRGANWNGRQIRNAFQTASALAEFEAHERNKKAKARSVETGDGFVPVNPQLRVRHFEEIAWASYEFDNYISETRGFTETEIAYREGQRMDAYRPSRRLVRDTEHQQTQTRGSPARISVPSHGPRPKAPGQSSQYDQPPARRETRPVNTYGARTVAPITRNERSSIATSRPKTVQPPTSFAAPDRDRQRQVGFDHHEPQYEYEDQEEMEYDQAHEGSLSQPMSTRANFDDANPPEISPLRRQSADFFPGPSRKPAGYAYAEDFDDDEDAFDR